MAKLPIDMGQFNADLDLNTIKVEDKDSGILARQFAPVSSTYTGKGFLSINGGTGFRLFTEGTETDTKNKKQRGNMSATVRTLPCITLHDIIVVDRKLFKIYNAGIEYDVTENLGNLEAVRAWEDSDNYTALREALSSAIKSNAQRVIDNLGLYGVDAYGTDVPGITGANSTTNVSANANASTAITAAGRLVGTPVKGSSSASFAASLQTSEDAKTSNATDIGFGDFSYKGIAVGVADTVNANEAFVYSNSAFMWGFAGNVEAEVLREATLDDGTNLALSDQYGLRVDIYVGTLWNLNKVAKATTVTTTSTPKA